MPKEKHRNYGFAGLLPLFVFLILYVGSLIFFTIKGASEPSKYMPRQVAILLTLVFSLIFFEPRKPFDEKLSIYLNHAGSADVMNLALTVMMAGGFASAIKASGGQTAIVNLGTSLIPNNFLIPGVFIISAFISLCIGTSMGTIVTMLPVTFALVKTAQLNPGMAGAAVISGSCFGDGLSMIGGTTIAATIGVEANMKDKFILQMKLAGPSAILTTILYIFMSFSSQSAGVMHTGSYNWWTILPYFVVLGLSVMGMNVAAVLSIGIFLASLMGILTGKEDFFSCTMAIGQGMESMFWIFVFSIMVSGVVALMRYYGGIDWLVQTIKKHIKTRTSCEALISILTFLVSGTVVNNNVAVLMLAPIAKELGSRYQVRNEWLAVIMSIFAVTATMVIPQGAIVMMTLQASQNTMTYLDLLKYMFYPAILMLLTLVVILLPAKLKSKNSTNYNG